MNKQFLENQIIALIFSRLGGHKGASPEVVKIEPTKFKLPYDEIIRQTLPFGGKIDDFFNKTIAGERLLVYLFKIQNIDYRADLASISIVYKEGANQFILRDAIIDLFAFFGEKNILSVEMVKHNLARIMDCFNNNSKIDIEALVKLKKKNYTFDYPKYLKKRGYTIMKKMDSFLDKI